MFSSTQTTTLVVLLAAALAASTAPALASSTSTATATTGPGAEEIDATTPPGNNTTVADAGYGILDAARGDTDNATTIARQLAQGLVVESVEYRDGYALVTVINSRPEVVRLTVTDANSIKTGGGSFVVAQERYTLPKGTFELKVPAQKARGGDQTITVASAVMDRPIGFSDPGGGDGPLLRGRGTFAWLAGAATVATGVIIGGVWGLAGEDGEPIEAGRHL